MSHLRTNSRALKTHEPSRFLLARLHVDSLIDKRTKAKVVSALNNLSKGNEALNDAYSEAIIRIDGQLQHDRVLAKNVLSWISYAQRPLTAGELCHALAVGVGDEELDSDNIPDVEDILSVCAALVTVDEESQVIRLVHYTTQDYLESTREKWNPNAQYNIASTCLTYLCFEPFRSGSCPSDAEFEIRLDEHKFLDYAARYWNQHIATVQKKTSELAMFLLQNSKLVACTLQTRSIGRYKYWQYNQSFPKQATDLHLAVSLGLLYLSKELLFSVESEKTILADVRDGDSRTPLMWAAGSGHKDTVELLLGTGKVDVDAKDNSGQTPLMWAVGSGHKDTVELLLGTGKVDVDASSEGHKQIVEMLLDNKADVNGQGGSYSNALQAASAAGHQAIVQLLLDNGADVNRQGGVYSNALNAAAAESHLAIAKLLLENGAEVSRYDIQGKSVLHHTTNNAHCTTSLVDFLLSQGAPMNTADIKNMTPLHYSVKFGHESIARLLLDRGVPIDVGVYRKKWYQTSVKTYTTYQLSVSESMSDISCASAGLTPLHFAALIGHPVMAKFLLKRGADPNALSEYDESPLHLTLRKTLHGLEYQDDWTDTSWRVERLWDLLDFEEDAFDAVHADITKNREGVLDALLSDTRTSLTLKDYKNEHVLHCVEYGVSGSASVVQKLVSRGANPLESNHRQQNALHLASRAGDHDAVVALLSLGAGLTLMDDEGLNALHYASQSGNHETITVLLETAGTKISSLVVSKDTHGRNSLHHLLRKPSRVRIETVQLLLDKGADGSELDATGNSPLASYLKHRWMRIDVDICQLLLSVKGNSLSFNKDGQNLGHLCASTLACRVQVLEVLNEHGVHLTRKDLQGRTILHCAAISGSLTEESLHYFLYVVGIKMNTEDASGKTVLQHALEMTSKDHDPQMFDSGHWNRTTRILQDHMSVKQRIEC